MKNYYQTLIVSLLCGSLTTFAQTPVFSSYPSAAATIYLDFNGQYITGTSWNMNGPIICGPSNLNASQITEIFNRVAEDYRPFNVNVTTDSTKYWAAPSNQRIRIVHTITSDWYGSAGGVSFMGSFTWGDNTPAFVFTALLNYKAKNIGEAASHEAGHTLGLRHQSRYDGSCVKREEYNSGDGSGEISWAPIMGVGYYKNLTTWHNGPSSTGCTNEQDDLAIITSADNGFGYRPASKAASSFSSATSIAVENNQLTANGVIITSTDKNFYKFSLAVASPVKINIQPYSVAPGDNGSNLDVQVQLFNGKQNLINTYNPPELLNAAIDTTLNAGTYYLVIKGAGNAFTSEYASLGSYTIHGSTNSFVMLPLHKLELRGKKEGNLHKLDWVIGADENVVKQTLEFSANGRNYHTITQPASDERAYSYVAGGENITYYRLGVVLDNGQQQYSNVIALSSTTQLHPSLAGNIVRNNISINSPSVFQYQIIDYNGRQISKGKLAQGVNSISSTGLINGVYMVQFNSGREQYTAKFMKQ